ncbi:unnamed protein product [Prunus armeniaca]
MSDSESPFEREPNAFDGESSDDQGETNSEAPIPLVVVYSTDSHADVNQHCEFQMGDTWVPDEHTSHQSETSTSSLGEATAEPFSQLSVSIVHQGNPRVPIGMPKEHLFGIDYLELNKMTVREPVKLRAEYYIPDSVKMRIPGPTESLSSPEDGGSVVITTCHAEDTRPNRECSRPIQSQLLVALMRVIVAFGIAKEGEPSYEQFSYLYSIIKSKSADHGGWVQANYLRASKRGHFVSTVSTSQKSYRNQRVLLSGNWESPSGMLVPFTFPLLSRLSQPNPTQSEIRQVDKLRLKVPAADRVYSGFLFTENLIRARLVSPTEMTDAKRFAEAKRTNESSKRCLMMGLKEKKKIRQPESVLVQTAEVDPEDQTLADWLRQLSAEPVPSGAAEADSPSKRGRATEVAASKAAKKRPITVADEDIKGCLCCRG